MSYDPNGFSFAEGRTEITERTDPLTEDASVEGELLPRVLSQEETEYFIAELVSPKIQHYLKAAALKLAQSDHATADDLVQDTFMRALSALQRGKYTPQKDTPFYAWLRTILLNKFLSDKRRLKFRGELADFDTAAAQILQMGPRQEWVVELKQVRQISRDELSPTNQEALLLVSAGVHYEDVAQQLGVPIGTVKSNVSRARTKLRGIVDSPTLAAKNLGYGD